MVAPNLYESLLPTIVAMGKSRLPTSSYQDEIQRLTQRGLDYQAEQRLVRQTRSKPGGRHDNAENNALSYRYYSVNRRRGPAGEAMSTRGERPFGSTSMGLPPLKGPKKALSTKPVNSKSLNQEDRSMLDSCEMRSCICPDTNRARRGLWGESSPINGLGGKARTPDELMFTR